MGNVNLPGVVTIKGLLYFRRRVTDAKGKRKPLYRRLPALTDPGFAAAYAAASADVAPVRQPAQPGTMAALAAAFRADLPKRRNRHGKPLSAATLANYRTYADRIEADHGHELIASLTTRDCVAIQDGMADTPGTAHIYMAVLRDMMALACRRGWAKHNPVREVKALPLGEHEPWPDRVIAAAVAAAPSAMTRLAIVTYLCSGARGGDVIRMRRDWHDGRIMMLTQGKTRKVTAIPMHPQWLAALAAVQPPAGQVQPMTLLYGRDGQPFRSVATLRERIKDVLAKEEVQAAIAAAVEAGEMEPGRDLTPHGLRKNAACYLAEAGATDEEIGIITGMSPDMVRHYTRRVRARKIAERMIAGPVGANLKAIPGLTALEGGKK